ncbi:MAG: anhydro-N-acetylmuramic acid kinase, partial [Gemmatimonadota bacterium]
MSDLFVGLMSGTSLDGIDAALVEFGGRDERPERARLVAFLTRPYPSDLSERLADAVAGRGGSASLGELDFDLGRLFADSVDSLLRESDVSPREVTAVGSHGQTVWHRPPDGSRSGSTLQIGEPAVIAERTGIDVVSDFRVRDVAAGGHGAPLTPLFDLMILSRSDRSLAIQNLGGMANVTGLPGGANVAAPVAFDTGPGVALIDEAARRLSEGTRRFDPEGRLAAAGEVVPAALDPGLEDPFFAER